MSRPKLTALSDLMPPKGAATRPEPMVMFAGKQDSELSSKQANEQIKLQVSADDPRRAGPDHPLDYQDGPRSAVSFRMTERLQDRLREYAHRARRKKQDILDQAVHEFLHREGY
jgi:hypothetical protein